MNLYYCRVEKGKKGELDILDVGTIRELYKPRIIHEIKTKGHYSNLNEPVSYDTCLYYIFDIDFNLYVDTNMYLNVEENKLYKSLLGYIRNDKLINILDLLK